METTNFKEEDINRVTQEIEKQNLNPTETLSRESIHEAVRSAYPSIPANPTGAAPGTPASSIKTSESKNLPDYLINAPADVKNEVERLISIAQRDGIGKAISAASAAGPFMLDALHDALVDKLYPELVKKGVIKDQSS